jgi:hypothetical protein
MHLKLSFGAAFAMPLRVVDLPRGGIFVFEESFGIASRRAKMVGQ